VDQCGRGTRGCRLSQKAQLGRCTSLLSWLADLGHAASWVSLMHFWKYDTKFQSWITRYYYAALSFSCMLTILDQHQSLTDEHEFDTWSTDLVEQNLRAAVESVGGGDAGFSPASSTSLPGGCSSALAGRSSSEFPCSVTLVGLCIAPCRAPPQLPADVVRFSTVRDPVPASNHVQTDVHVAASLPRLSSAELLIPYCN